MRKRVVVDRDYLKAGSNTDKALAKAICESVCMIVVFVPAYSDSIYCKREFMAMEKIERKRKLILGRKYDETRRMIIPIILRGDPNALPRQIKKITYTADFSKFQTTGRNMWRLKNYQPKVEGIVEYVYKHYEALRALETKGKGQNCASFCLPSKLTTSKKWTNGNRKQVVPFFK